ncbi:MAG TPA: signal peptidase II, partial [Ardenticatenaceae bacterium]|nr:signal peptidase II [Ardenticatenaceae bacterium]
MTPESALARPHRNYRWLLWPVALLVFVADQATKLIVARELALWESWRPFEEFPLSIFAITHISNTGAAFGILPNASLFFVVVAIVVSGAIAYYYRRLPSHHWWLFLSLGLQLGGALGNLVDRLRLGYVVDFIEVGIWPIFNVADSSIVVGVLLLA